MLFARRIHRPQETLMRRSNGAARPSCSSSLAALVADAVHCCRSPSCCRRRHRRAQIQPASPQTDSCSAAAAFGALQLVFQHVKGVRQHISGYSGGAKG